MAMADAIYKYVVIAVGAYDNTGNSQVLLTLELS